MVVYAVQKVSQPALFNAPAYGQRAWCQVYSNETFPGGSNLHAVRTLAFRSDTARGLVRGRGRRMTKFDRLISRGSLRAVSPPASLSSAGGFLAMCGPGLSPRSRVTPTMPGHIRAPAGMFCCRQGAAGGFFFWPCPGWSHPPGARKSTLASSFWRAAVALVLKSESLERPPSLEAAYYTGSGLLRR